MSRPAYDDAEFDLVDVDRIRRAVANLEPGDFELVPPPAGLWDRIAEAVQEEPVPTVVEYRIDANDVVVEVGADWAAFARAGDAGELAHSTTGRTLWSCMDDEARDLWQLLVARVRSEQAEVVVPLRCDAPHVRRWFDLTLTPQADGGVHFRSVLAWEEPRPLVELLSVDAQRDVDAAPIASVSRW